MIVYKERSQDYLSNAKWITNSDKELIVCLHSNVHQLKITFWVIGLQMFKCQQFSQKIEITTCHTTLNLRKKKNVIPKYLLYAKLQQAFNFKSSHFVDNKPGNYYFSWTKSSRQTSSIKY